MFRPLIPVWAICSSPYLLLGSQPLLPCLSKWPPKGLLGGSESAKTERTECFSSTSARSTRLKCSLLTRVRCALSSGCLFAHKQLKRQLAFPRQCQGLTVYCWLRRSASSFWTLTLFFPELSFWTLRRWVESATYCCLPMESWSAPHTHWRQWPPSLLTWFWSLVKSTDNFYCQ